MKSHIIGFLLVTVAQILMPIKIGTTFQNKLRPTLTALLGLAITNHQPGTDYDSLLAGLNLGCEVKFNIKLGECIVVCR